MPAEPKLVEFAYRVGQDLPEDASVVKFEQMDESFETEALGVIDDKEDLINPETVSATNMKPSFDIVDNTTQPFTAYDEANECNALAETYERMMGILGRFKH